MKKILIALSLCIFLLLSADSNAQTFKELIEKKRQEMKDKANAKLDQKTSQGIDDAVNSPERIIKKKKEKNKDNKTKIKEVVTTETPATGKTKEIKETTTEVTSDNSMNGEGAQTVIQTNINCEVGKKKIEVAMKKIEGILEVKTNIKNGELSIRYNNNSAGYTKLLQLINEQGFEADGNKPTTGAPNNPCKK